jgi:hypothetical protein
MAEGSGGTVKMFVGEHADLADTVEISGSFRSISKRAMFSS